jgi:hypothetical protein
MTQKQYKSDFWKRLIATSELDFKFCREKRRTTVNVQNPKLKAHKLDNTEIYLLHSSIE